MPKRLIANGEPVTDWENVRARDVDLWIPAVRAAQGIDPDVPITVQTRAAGTYGDETQAATDAMSKAELLAMADAAGLDVPAGATKAQIVDLING